MQPITTEITLFISHIWESFVSSMSNKRQGREKEDENDSDRQNRRRVVEGTENEEDMQELIIFFEPLIRKCVKEGVEAGINRFLRPFSSGVRCSGSRVLQLRFVKDLPETLYTDSRVRSRDGSPIEVALYDSVSGGIVTSGSLSATKVKIVALSGDFKPDDQEGWSEEDFDHAVVPCREGKKPLLTGELTIPLQNGVGQINAVIFTDNSSWTRSRRFRLGAKAHQITDDVSIREALSNGFQVKDHRGESYEKHHPPLFHDNVWRLEKIAKGGVYHQKLRDIDVNCVGDLLRLHETNPQYLQEKLGNIPKNIWKAIINHARTCVIDDKRYMYMAPTGIELIFDSVCKVVGVRFNGQSIRPFDTLNDHEKKTVEVLKQHVHRNIKDWDDTYSTLPANPSDSFAHSNLDFCEGDFHAEQGTPMSNHQPMTILPCDHCQVGNMNNCFEIGESSRGFNPALGNSLGTNAYSPVTFFGDICMGSEDLPVDENFQFESPACFLGSNNHEIGMPEFIIPRILTPKIQWCKLLSVVKWRILVKRRVAARQSI